MRSIHPGTAAPVVGIVPSEPAKSMPRNTRPDPPPRIKKTKASNSGHPDARRSAITSDVILGIFGCLFKILWAAKLALCSCSPAWPIAAITAETIPVKKNPSGTRASHAPWFAALDAPKKLRTATAPPALASMRNRTIARQYSAAGRLIASILLSVSWASAIGGIVAPHAAGATLHRAPALNLSQ